MPLRKIFLPLVVAAACCCFAPVPLYWAVGFPWPPPGLGSVPTVNAAREATAGQLPPPPASGPVGTGLPAKPTLDPDERNRYLTGPDAAPAVAKGQVAVLIVGQLRGYLKVRLDEVGAVILHAFRPSCIGIPHVNQSRASVLTAPPASHRPPHAGRRADAAPPHRPAEVSSVGRAGPNCTAPRIALADRPDQRRRTFPRDIWPGLRYFESAIER
jgi:hypothetical protein